MSLSSLFDLGTYFTSATSVDATVSSTLEPFLLCDPLLQTVTGFTDFPITNDQYLNPEEEGVSSKHAKRVSNPNLNRNPTHNRGKRPQNVDEEEPKRSHAPRRQKHVHSERQRRSSMNNLLATMRSLLPTPMPATVDKCTLVSESIKYIQSLQETFEQLQQERDQLVAAAKCSLDNTTLCERESPTDVTSCFFIGGSSGADRPPNVLGSKVVHNTSNTMGDQRAQIEQNPTVQVQLSCSENDIFITLTSCKRRSFWSEVMQVLEEEKLETISCSISTSDHVVFTSIHAKAVERSGLSEHSIRTALQNLPLYA